MKRLVKEYEDLKLNPPELVIARPSELNILEWHFILSGPPNTPYEGGKYHGRLLFTKNYPFSPPSLIFYTPNGRFNTKQNICLSITNYHPDQWNPSWTIEGILIGLLSFMTSTGLALGAVKTSDQTKKLLAKKSIEFNKSNELFVKHFPELVTLEKSEPVKNNQNQGSKEETAEKNDASKKELDKPLLNNESVSAKTETEVGFFGAIINKIKGIK